MKVKIKGFTLVAASQSACYRLFKPGSGFCLSLVPSGPMRVSARTDRLKNKKQKTKNNKQTNPGVTSPR